MRSAIAFLFVVILAVMLFITIRASLHCSLFDVPAEVVGDPWFQATLVDAYCGFVTFFAWVAYRERTWIARGGWFIAIMALGNIAMAIYVLWHLYKLPKGAKPGDLLLRPLPSK